MYVSPAAGCVTQRDMAPAPAGRPKPPEAAQTEPESRDMADVVRAAVDKWPPLSDAQRERLSLLLRPGQTH